MFSQPALTILGQNEDWKPVLQKLGQVLVAVNPDPYVNEYLEFHNMYNNRFHFLNEYLHVNKTGGKSTTPPPIETARALQRLSVLLMSGFFFFKFSQLKHDSSYCETTKYQATKKVASIDKTDDYHLLYKLGYDIAMRNWLMEKQGVLKKIPRKVVEKKEAAKKVENVRVADGEALIEKFGEMEQKLVEMMDEKLQGMTDLVGTIITKLNTRKVKKDKSLIAKAAMEDEVKEGADDEEDEE